MSSRNVSPVAWASQTQVKLTMTLTYTDGSGSRQVTIPEITDTYALEKVETIDLVNGNNTITVPSTANTTGVIIVPPDGNTASLKLKGVNGDTGVGATIQGFHVVMFGPAGAPANFVIFTSAAAAGCKFYWF